MTYLAIAGLLGCAVTLALWVYWRGRAKALDLALKERTLQLEEARTLATDHEVRRTAEIEILRAGIEQAREDRNAELAKDPEAARVFLNRVLSRASEARHGSPVPEGGASGVAPPRDPKAR